MDGKGSNDCRRLAATLSLAEKLANLTSVYLENGFLDFKGWDHAEDSFRDLVDRVRKGSATALREARDISGDPQSAQVADASDAAGDGPDPDAPVLFADLAEIPSGAKLLIFGASGPASQIKRELATKRPDVTVVGFADAEGGRTLEDLPVIPAAGLARGGLSFDLVLVASIHYRQIVRNLRSLGIDRFLVAAPELVHEYIYRPAELRELAPRFEAVLDMLATPADKELYAFLLEARSPASPYTYIETENEVEYFYAYLKNFRAVQEKYLKNLTGQYIDFINPEAVTTGLHAGVCDGLTSVAMLQAFPGLTTLYGFDPLGGEYMTAETRQALNQSGKFRLFNLALYSHDAGVAFCERPEYPVGSFVQEAPQPGSGLRHMPSITLDAFCARENIGKLDYLALDVEESERHVLKGGEEVIRRDRPILAISIYHGKQDFFEIPLYLKGLCDDYAFRLGHYSYGLYDTIFYAIPAEKQ